MQKKNYCNRVDEGVVLKPKRLYEAAKRLIDLILAIIGLVVLSPVLVVFGVWIKIDSKGPIIYKQERVGLNGSLFHVVKLRSMGLNAEKNGMQWAAKNDNRVTRVGKIIRKTRIDEIPQFVNVLKGEMSIIGPRPERKYYTDQFNKDIPGFEKRLWIKPGITGWAQVNGGYEITPREKLVLDLEYMEKRNLLLDIKIVIKTILIVFTADGAR